MKAQGLELNWGLQCSLSCSDNYQDVCMTLLKAFPDKNLLPAPGPGHSLGTSSILSVTESKAKTLRWLCHTY